MGNNTIGIDVDGIYLRRNTGGTYSNAASGTIHISSKTSSYEFSIVSVNVAAQLGKTVTYAVRFNNTGAPVQTETVSNSNRDSADTYFNYKRITFSSPTSVKSVDIDITDNSTIPFVGSNASIIDFVVNTLPAPPAVTNYTLTYTAGTGGTLSGTSPQMVASGESGTAVTAIPDTHYHFVKWSDNVTTATRTETGVTGDLNVSAIFALDTYTLTYTAGANGTITGASPQTVGYNLSGTAVTAVPSTGYHLVNWSDGSTDATRTDTGVTADKSLTANFAINEYTLTYTAGANGTLSDTTPQTVEHGSNGTAVTAIPDTHYHFVKWSDNVTTATRTETGVTGDLNVSAIFALDT
ncbi:InlB B-repeat-containing protein, partial [Paenibacillus oryzisoli]|uniref:InlB B-repeat-containing protein n=1 Tax=Paenibacillus oryzisoli TaxID=1850517 RepID=UPI003D2B5F9B